MHLPVDSRVLVFRDDPSKIPSPPPNNANMTWVGIGIAAIVILTFIFIYYQAHRLRHKHPNPRYIPTQYLKSKWRTWEPRRKYNQITAPSTAHHDNATPLTTTTSTSYAQSAEFPTTSPEVDRRTSVRSIMTLPPYRYTPHPSEQLIAREGERAGVDTVVEYPESETEVETRREEEMEALFTIRQARRREAEEREERRQERRDAREQGDWARLQQLERESRARARARSDASLLTANAAASPAGSNTNLQAGLQNDSAFLIAELASIREAGRRSRRVSSVSYADLGLARHDGSRIRADSVESDVRPLLDSAASMGGSRGASRQSSPGQRRGRSHMRNQSDASASMMTVDSDVGPAVNTPRTSARNSDENGVEGVQLTPASSEEAGAPLPSTDPPRYEDESAVPVGEAAPPYESSVQEEAPPYESPVRARGEGLPVDTSAGRMQRRDGSERRHSRGSSSGARSAIEERPSGSDPSEEAPVATPPQPRRGRAVPQLRTTALRQTPAISVLSATPVEPVPGYADWGRRAP